MRLDRYVGGGYSGGGITETGGNISGALLLAGNPSQTLEAVPKQYVDAYYNSVNASNFTAGTLPAARLPALTGDLQTVAGTSQFTLNNNGVTAGQYSKVNVNAKGLVTGGGNIANSDIPFGLNWNKVNPSSLPATLSGYGITNGVSVNGGTLTGFLTLSVAPSSSLHAATKQYIDGLISSGGIGVGDIIRKPYATTPSGFLKCNGSEVDKTTYANLYAVISDQYQENTFSGSGKPWQMQYDINPYQTGDITGWAAENGLPYYVAYSNTIVTKNRVYVIGGHTNTTPTNAVYYAPINADGSLGTWTAATGLPAATFHNEVIVVKNKVYILGGQNASNTAPVSTVYSAVINADGSLGSWVTETSLPYAFQAMSAFATKNRIYLCGGYNGSAYINTVIYATIGSDGSLGTWTYGTNLPVAYSSGEIAVIKNKVYLVGGAIGAGASATADIYSADIYTDGSIGTFTVVSTLPTPVCIAQLYVSKNTLYVITGNTGSAYLTNTYYCNINQDGSLGTWVVGSAVALAAAYTTIAAGKNRIYQIGGFNGGYLANVYSAPINGGLNDYSDYYMSDVTNYLIAGAGRPWEQQYQINTTQSTDITGWATGTSLPTTLISGGIVVTKNYVYLLGGFTGTAYHGNVYVAPINSDGTLGTWASGTALPGPVGYPCTFVTKNRVYITAGYINSGVSSTVYTAPINSDGTLGTWTTTTSLPGPVYTGVAITTRNRAYILGGSTASNVYSSTVYTAVINSDGTLGSWSTAASLPGAIGYSVPIVTKNRVYLLGGYNGAVVSTVYTATINSDGVIGSWSVSTSLPTTLYGGCGIVTAGRVYLIGGNNGSGASSAVYSAPLNSDGTIGTWSAGTALPGGYSLCIPVITKNHIYLLGGHNGSTGTSIVFSAPISSSINNDYSPYYDGSFVPNDVPNSSAKFTLPDLSASEAFGSYSYIKY